MHRDQWIFPDDCCKNASQAPRSRDPWRRTAKQRYVKVTDYGAGAANQSGFAPENLTTLPHFSVCSTRSLPKPAAEPGSREAPSFLEPPDLNPQTPTA